jgi:hypothetical protein
MNGKLLACLAALAACPAHAEAPPAGAPPAAATTAPVWTRTKVIVCEVLRVYNCSDAGCQAKPKLPSFRVDIQNQTMCGITAEGCRNQIKIGEVGLDGSGTHLTVHALGVAFVIGVDGDGTMNGADVVKGRVVVIGGRCVPGK